MKIEDGYLKIDIDALVGAMSDEQLRELAKTAIFQEAVIGGVCEMLVDGYMWQDDPVSDHWYIGGDTFQNFREKLMPLMPDVAKEAIIQLKDSRDRARHEEKKWRDACFALKEAWYNNKFPDERRDYYHGPRMTKDQAGEYLDGIDAKDDISGVSNE